MKPPFALLLLAGLVAATPALAAPDDPARPVVAVYEGHYRCTQGYTRLTLYLARRQRGAPDVVTFEFGPTTSYPDIPAGEYTLSGTLDPAGGDLVLEPRAWVNQPPGYSMVGLTGQSTDGGETFSGEIVAPVPGCTTFTVTRTRFGM